MIAQLVAGEDRAGEPVVARGQDRQAVRPLAPLAAGELVYLVAGGSAEELGEVLGRAGTKWTARALARMATRQVRFLSERQTRKRGGSMLHWVAKPSRQPARSSPARVVAMNIG